MTEFTRTYRTIHLEHQLNSDGVKHYRWSDEPDKIYASIDDAHAGRKLFAYTTGFTFETKEPT